METVIKAVGTAVLLFGLIVLLSLLFAYPTLLVVNYLFTSSLLLKIFGIPALTFWKAFWLNYLCANLLKSTTTSSSK
jgi:hypothetical protein